MPLNGLRNPHVDGHGQSSGAAKSESRRMLEMPHNPTRKVHVLLGGKARH